MVVSWEHLISVQTFCLYSCSSWVRKGWMLPMLSPGLDANIFANAKITANPFHCIKNLSKLSLLTLFFIPTPNHPGGTCHYLHRKEWQMTANYAVDYFDTLSITVYILYDSLELFTCFIFWNICFILIVLYVFYSHCIICFLFHAMY